MKSFNTNGISRRWLGVGLSLMAAVAAQASTQVTFMVDMSTETPGFTAVYTTGSFPEAGPWNSPNSLLMINTTGTIWSNTFTLNDPVGTIEQVKFTDNTTGWSSVNNYEFLLGTTGDTTTTPGTEILPLQTWNGVSTWPVPTNNVTFQVDMSAQVLLGNFIPGDPVNGVIQVAGDSFPNQWGAGNYVLTNNPNLSGNLSNVYSGIVPTLGFLPINPINYKFRMNGGWESVNNRTAVITNNPQVLPLVYYNDNSVYDLMPAPITVNFSVYMPSGTLDISGYAFNPSNGDTLWINGDFLNGWNGGTWPGPIGNFPAGQQMFLSAIPNVYTNTFIIPKGNPVTLNYKYSIDSQDDENGFQTNHVREIRSYGPTYTMPQDTWSLLVCPPGTPYPNPGISSTNIVEPDFGYLTIGTPSAGNLPITWLGRPGVELLNRASLTTGIWNPNSGTDGTQSTNWAAAGNVQQFFRLLKKQ